MPAAKRRIAILGTVNSTRRLAPFDNPDFEIFCTGGDTAKTTPRFTRWYEVHDPAVLLNEDLNPALWIGQHLSFLKKQGDKVFVRVESEQLPDATLFPYREIVGTFTPEFITSGPAIILAHILYEELHQKKRNRLKHLEIHLYGLDMADDEERAEQWAGVQHFNQLAEAFGATVLVPEGSTLTRTRLPYPLDNENELAVCLRARRATLLDMKKHFEAMRDDATANLQTLDGAVQEIERTLRIHC